MTMQRRIELPGVHGRIDHMDVDVDGGRLFVAALASDSLEVIDLRAGRRVDRITSLHEPQGVAYLPRTHRVLVANGSGGGVQAFTEGKSPATASQPALDDADNLRVDEASGTVYVGFGKALAALDPDALHVIRTIHLDGHPESFQIEKSGRRIYANVPSARQIAVIDREAGRVEATWPVRDASRNFAMALDEGGHRLFVATRLPARLLVYDTASGKRIDDAVVCGDADDLFFDGARQQLYVVCGQGVVDVVRRNGDHFAVAEHVPTAPGARTGLFVPGTSTLVVAVPAQNGAPAEMRVFSLQ